MPFGPNCEYSDMDDCIKKNSDKDDPAAYCSVIMRETEESCAMATARELLTQARQRRPRPIGKAQPRQWFRFENKTSKTPELYIYDEISWWGITAQDLIDELREIDADELIVHLNSPGGDVFDGFAIYQALLEHKAEVHVKIDSLAASIASVIAMAGDTRTISTVGTMMIHDAWGFAMGYAEDMRRTGDLLDKLSDTIASVYALRAGRTRDYWRGFMKEETWFDSEEAKAAGLVTEIYGEALDDESIEARASWDLSVFRHAGREEAPAPQLDRPAASVAVVVEPTADDEIEFGDGVLASIGPALREELEEPFYFDPETFKVSVADAVNDAPAHTPVEGRYKDPDADPFDGIGQALREALLG